MKNEDEQMPEKSVMNWMQEWCKLAQGEETARPSVYPIRVEGLEYTTNGTQEFTVEFMYTGPESSALEAVKAELKERGIVNVVEAKETKMSKTTAQYVNEQVGKEMKELEARLVAAGYGKETEMNAPKTVTYPVKFEAQEDGSWMALCRDLRPDGTHAFLTDGSSFAEARANAADALDEIRYQYAKQGSAMPFPSTAREGEELITSKCDNVEHEDPSVEELEAKISKLQKEQDKRQKETDNLVLELRQYVERYRNANTRAIAAETKLAEFVRQGVLKMTPNGHEPVLTREHIDETVFMCKIRANRMAESFHEFKYQNNNAFATPAQREEAETKYLTALQLFNDTFSAL